MTENPILFYIASFLLFVFTVLSLCCKNVIYSLLCAIMVFFSGAVFFYILGSEYNAIIQAGVYGLAVPVIVGLSVMFSGAGQSNKEKNNKFKINPIAYLTILCGCIFVYFMSILPTILPDSFNVIQIPEMNSYDVISSFAKNIFIDYVWAFELLSLLLTVAIIGLTLFKRRGA